MMSSSQSGCWSVLGPEAVCPGNPAYMIHMCPTKQHFAQEYDHSGG